MDASSTTSRELRPRAVSVPALTLAPLTLLAVIASSTGYESKGLKAFLFYPHWSILYWWVQPFKTLEGGYFLGLIGSLSLLKA